MRFSNKCYIILTLFFFTSCASRINVTETETNSVKDSIVYIKEKEIIPPIIDTLFVESPCDSLGNLKDFDKEIRTPKTALNLRSRNGRIEVLFDQQEIISENITSNNISESVSEKISDKKEVIYKTDIKLILILIISVLLNIFLLKEKIKKFIPFI